VTGLFMAPVVDQFMFGITVPVEIGDERRYVLGKSQDQHALARLVAANELPPGRLAVVADAAHHIIARSEQEDAFIGKELPPDQWHRAEPAGIFEFTDSEGRPSLQAYARSELTGWETAVWGPAALLGAPVQELWWTIVLTALAAFALVVTLASWLGRLIARSVAQAAQAATNLGEGSPLPSYEPPVPEVDTLMAELRRAAARRQAAERDLQASKDQLQMSKDRLQLAFDATRLGWWQYDPHRRIVSVDARTKEIFDLTADKMPIDEVMERVHPDDAERFWANSEAALDPANPKPFVHHEFRVRRQDGTVRWVEGHGLAILKVPGLSDGREFGGTAQTLPNAKSAKKRKTSSCAKSIIAPRTC
jgi:PAS domain S-box-containing protein